MEGRFLDSGLLLLCLSLLLDVFSSQIRHLEIIDPSVDVSEDHYLQKVQTTGTFLLFL